MKESELLLFLLNNTVGLLVEGHSEKLKFKRHSKVKQLVF